MSRTQCEYIFAQTAFSHLYVKWHCELLRFFDDGQLKAQRLIRKILIVAKPKFKQHQF